MSWRNRAACIGVNTDVFMSKPLRHIALRICGECPVRVECLVDAIQQPFLDAVLGGCEPAELKILQAQLQAQQANRHGSLTRYGSGCRCEPCRLAKREYQHKVRKEAA